MLPRAFRELIEALGVLPGVGSRTAERYAYFLFKSDQNIPDRLVDALSGLHKGVRFCPVTFALMDASDSVSPLYADPTRDKSTVLVVEEPLDIYAVESTRAYHGTYHVLGGAISPIDGIDASNLHISPLIKRLKTDQVKELIIATNPSIEGESTAVFLEHLVHQNYPGLKITRLARGLPLGVSLEYADQITLASALENRTKL